MSGHAAASPEVWTIGRLLNWTKQHFQTRGVNEPRLAAELLLAKALGCRKIDLYTRFEQEPTAEQRTGFREMVVAAAEHQPIAYLIGRKEFYSLDFEVTRDVLIPRPETELLVELALTWLKVCTEERHEVLDLGTGSGCIGATIAKRAETARVTATDTSEGALNVAIGNAQRHGVAERVTCLQADWLNLPDGCIPAGGFHLIVSNPPYVPSDNPSILAENVRKFEPAAALFGGADGLEFYRRLAAGARAFLRPEGELLVEIGRDQATAVEAILAGGGLTSLSRHRDLNGIERVIRFGPAA